MSHTNQARLECWFFYSMFSPKFHLSAVCYMFSIRRKHFIQNPSFQNRVEWAISSKCFFRQKSCLVIKTMNKNVYGHVPLKRLPQPSGASMSMRGFRDTSVYFIKSPRFPGVFDCVSAPPSSSDHTS